MRSAREVVGRAVGRAVVDDEELEVVERLREDALHRLRQEPQVVVDRHQHGHERLREARRPPFQPEPEAQQRPLPLRPQPVRRRVGHAGQQRATAAESRRVTRSHSAATAGFCEPGPHRRAEALLLPRPRTDSGHRCPHAACGAGA